MKNQEEIHIENSILKRKLQDALKKYDIIYLQAPLGWGKYTFLKDFCEEQKDTVWVEQMDEIPQSDDRAYTVIIPRFERLLQEGCQEQLLRLMEEKKRGRKFILGSSAGIPPEMVPFQLSHRMIIYGRRELRPSGKEIRDYFEKKDIFLKEEELLRIEKDLHNMPICIYMLENSLRNSSRGYCRMVREQCMEDVYTYLDVTFFRSFRVKEQNALLRLSCFEELTLELISDILGITDKQAGDFVKYLLRKGSVLENFGKDCWRFYPLFGLFLHRMTGKYMDVEERLELYQCAMDYLVEHHNYGQALKFADLLRNEEKLAQILDSFLAEHIHYSEFISLEDYYLRLSPYLLTHYPRLTAAGAILESISGNRNGADIYERMLWNMLEECSDEEKKQFICKDLLYLKVICPGGLDPEHFGELVNLMNACQDTDICSQSGRFQSCQLSVLHGSRDYSAFFIGRAVGFTMTEQNWGILAKTFGSGFEEMVDFIKMELCYEQNRLDEALDILSHCLTKARIRRDKNLMLLCNVKLVDIMMAKNQWESADAFLLRQIEDEMDGLEALEENFHARQAYYDMLKGQEDRVQFWMKEYAPDENGRFYTLHYELYLTKAKGYIWNEQYVSARMLLQFLLEFSESYGMYYLGIQVRLLEAVIYYREGNEEWKSLLGRALEMAQDANYIRVIADEGAAVYELLADYKALQGEKTENNYLKEVLRACRAQMLLYPGYLKPKKAVGEISFTSYEKDILHLLAVGEKNAEIARALSVSENTVKYHLKNIYQKLDVKNRSQAINRIAEYHLL